MSHNQLSASTTGPQLSNCYLRLKEVQKILGVSRATLYRLTHERGLRTIRCGGLVRIRQADLDAWSKKCGGDGDVAADHN
jgi:excisionase family DNA binding protein